MNLLYHSELQQDHIEIIMILFITIKKNNNISLTNCHHFEFDMHEQLETSGIIMLGLGLGLGLGIRFRD